MKLILVGADCEENLGMCMVSACASTYGHKTEVLALDGPDQADGVIAQVLKRNPGCVGLAMQFQHRSWEFLTLAARLRKAGYRGHITCGGQFPTMAYREVLEGSFGVNTVVLHEADHTMGQLLSAIENRTALTAVRGIAFLGADNKAIRTETRPLVADLDSLPLARRYRAHSLHMGIPFIPIWGSRGCWGSCSYCSISSGYREARAQSGGRTLRFRSPRNVATEMAVLWHAAGGSGIFCFHDETFLLPRPSDTLKRIREIRGWLDEFGVGKAAMVGKCRPESLTPELARELRDLGVIRLYIGVENASQRCADHLHRKTTTQAVRSAIDSALTAGIFPCYNLLIFEPEATIEDIEENVAFMREYSSVPINFCRAEAYHGTPLYEGLRKQGALGGSFLGWDYRLRDDRTELLFRICSAVFRERNFAARGVTNRSMGLGYAARVLEFFYEERDEARARIMRRATELTRELVTDKADLLDEAIALAKRYDLHDRERIERETALLGLRVAASDQIWHTALDAIIADMNAFARQAGEPRRKRVPNRTLAQSIQAMAVASSVAFSVSACGGKAETNDGVQLDAGADRDAQYSDVLVADCVPRDSAVDTRPDVYMSDAVPRDAGLDREPDVYMSDCLPDDAGQYSDGNGPYDALPFDGTADPPPQDAGTDVEDEPNMVDFVPQDAALDLEKALGSASSHDRQMAAARPDHGHMAAWHDTSPKAAVRSKDLPLYHPPRIALVAECQGDRVRVTIRGCTDPMSTKWQSRGEVTGQGESVEWVPESSDDQIRVAVRTRGGIAVASLRVLDLPKA